VGCCFAVAKTNTGLKEITSDCKNSCNPVFELEDNYRKSPMIQKKHPESRLLQVDFHIFFAFNERRIPNGIVQK
jgi:hypothetical protein